MMSKSGYVLGGYFEYTVYPLEGIWDIADEYKIAKEFNKDNLTYKLTIRQPDFVDEELFLRAINVIKKER